MTGVISRERGGTGLWGRLPACRPTLGRLEACPTTLLPHTCSSEVQRRYHVRPSLPFAAAGCLMALWPTLALPQAGKQTPLDIVTNKIDCSGDYGTACKFVKTP